MTKPGQEFPKWSGRLRSGTVFTKMAAVAGAAIAAAFAQAVEELVLRGISREDLARKLGVKPTSVSRYATGSREVPIDVLPIVDELLGRPKGHILRRAGYVDPESDLDLLAAIDRDPALSDPIDRELMRTAYLLFSSRHPTQAEVNAQILAKAADVQAAGPPESRGAAAS